MPKIDRLLTKKRQPRPGLCILIEDGSLCSNPIASRGLCGKHLAYLRTRGLIEKYALPRRSPLKQYALKETPEEGLCRVEVDGVPCRQRATRRGLCLKHYQGIWQREDLSLDDFVAPAPRYRKNKRPREGLCLVIEDDVKCTRSVHSRGLCKPHYSVLASTPEGLDAWALPRLGESTYALKANPKKGRCRVAENGAGCDGEAETRGLCNRHYLALRKKPELLEKYALPPRKVSHELTRKPDDQCVSGVCVVVDNGVPCTAEPERDGLCKRHRQIIWNSAEYQLAQFAVPDAKAIPTFARKKRLEEDLCLLIEAGLECTRPARSRGLCKAHYAKLRALGVVEDYALAPRTKAAGGRPKPHLYLDKNVLFDYAAYQVFGKVHEMSAVTLVRAIMRRELRATVSVDCVRSLYGHLRFRLCQEPAEGGLGYGPARAESEAREFVGELFFAKKGVWRFAPVTEGALENCTVRKKLSNLSLEDALELQAYLAARSEPNGPALFVTADQHFDEGAHPAHVVEHYQSLISELREQKWNGHSAGAHR